MKVTSGNLHCILSYGTSSIPLILKLGAYKKKTVFYGHYSMQPVAKFKNNVGGSERHPKFFEILRWL